MRKISRTDNLMEVAANNDRVNIIAVNVNQTLAEYHT